DKARRASNRHAKIFSLRAWFITIEVRMGETGRQLARSERFRGRQNSMAFDSFKTEAFVIREDYERPTNKRLRGKQPGKRLKNHMISCFICKGLLLDNNDQERLFCQLRFASSAICNVGDFP